MPPNRTTNARGHDADTPAALALTAALADPRLGFKAKGLLAWIVNATAAGEPVSTDRLTVSSSDGRTAVTSGLAELEDAGYLIREMARSTVPQQRGTFQGTAFIVQVPAGAE